jgi:streptogramin lyase
MKLTKLSIMAGLLLCLAVPAIAQFSNANGIVFDGSGNLWLANRGDNNVLKLDPSTGGILNAITDGINGPTRLAFDPSGRLWVANATGNNLTVYDDLSTAGANLVQTVTSSSIQNPLALVVDAYGDIYVGDNSANSVVAFNINDGLIETLTSDKSGFTFTAPGVLVIHGQDIYAGFGPNVGTNAVMSYNVGEFLTGDPKEITVYNDNVNTGPTGVAFDSHNNVYISEYTSNTWVRYTMGKGSTPTLVVNACLNGPEGIAVDKSGNVYVSNSNTNNIAVFNSSGTCTNTLN